MIIEIRIPSPGESITEVEMANWFISDGDFIEKDQEIGEVESDKATLPLIAEDSGKVSLKIKEGDTVKVGDVACEIDTYAKAPKIEKNKPRKKEQQKASEAKNNNEVKSEKQTDLSTKESTGKIKITPLAEKMMDEHQLDIDQVINGLKRISTNEIKAVLNNAGSSIHVSTEKDYTREVERNPMTSLRKKLSERLVAVKSETAMLTTFNEVNMAPIISLRKNYQKEFIEKHGVKLGFMSFFTMAVAKSLRLFPKVNSQIDGDDILMHSYCDIGIAVQTDKGLMVPVIRNAEKLGLAEIEMQIAALAKKARSFRLSIDEMRGGTFSITNGGVFGSLLSTPIINPPQSAILGMHNIVERPMAVDGKLEILPMMYVALSYDHRIIDGKDSVSFLVQVKEFLESPHKMLFEGKNPDNLLLEL